MHLLLIRHAQAAEQDAERYPDDVLRPLLPRGRKIHRRMSRRLVKLGLVPARIFSSPWKRAWQTAGITAEETGIGPPAGHLPPRPTWRSWRSKSAQSGRRRLSPWWATSPG
jgi:broad specificity phosphatase PhoE